MMSDRREQLGVRSRPDSVRQLTRQTLNPEVQSCNCEERLKLVEEGDKTWRDRLCILPSFVALEV